MLSIPNEKKNVITIKKPLELLHIDLFSPTRMVSLDKNMFVWLWLMISLDIFRFYSYVAKIKHSMLSKSFQNRFTRKKKYLIISLMTNHGTEFDNSEFVGFYERHGISNNFSAPCTFQQRVVEHRNRVIQEATKTMLNESHVGQNFWVEVLSTVYIRSFTSKTPYDLFRRRKPTVSYFQVFGSECLIKRLNRNLCKLMKGLMKLSFLAIHQMVEHIMFIVRV